jgi:hypothetical protein
MRERRAWLVICLQNLAAFEISPRRHSGRVLIRAIFSQALSWQTKIPKWSADRPKSGRRKIFVGLDGTEDRPELNALVTCMPSRLYALLRKLLGRSTASPVGARVGQRQVIGSMKMKNDLEMYVRHMGLDSFPNDLTRMLYLASLRDCNSGLYLHPQLSQSVGMERANEVLNACHHEVFGRLLTVPLSGYVLQMEEYVRYTRANRNTVLETWQSLQAYRSTIPVSASPLSSELFCLNIELALTILKDTPALTDMWLDQTPGRS